MSCEIQNGSDVSLSREMNIEMKSDFEYFRNINGLIVKEYLQNYYGTEIFLYQVLNYHFREIMTFTISSLVTQHYIETVDLIWLPVVSVEQMFTHQC